MASSIGHQSPQSTLPPLATKVVNTQIWLTTGNTDVVADPYIRANSIVSFMNTSAFVGPWWVTNIVPGVSFTVTSANSETQTTTTYSYILE